jgi:hypothetical protein
MSNITAWNLAVVKLLNACPEMKKWLVPEDEAPQNWVSFQAPNGHRILIARTAEKLPICHTSLPVAPGQSHHNPTTMSQIVLPSKHNGKIQAHFYFDVATIKTLIPLMSNPSLPLPASRRNASGRGGGRTTLSMAELLKLAEEQVQVDDTPAPVSTPVEMLDDVSEDDLVEPGTHLT